ncbi:MAG: Stress responsive alpha-beta barrel domain protein [Actinomycetia bacterium]|nr:Stress responsive alpha-beta barrel domain protein [Actinomycetes bacterium]
MSGFRHVAMFIWTGQATQEQKAAVAERLSELPKVIPEIKRYEIGDDAGINEGNYDFVVVADFADRESYFVYRDHPVHLAMIAETIEPIIAERAAVQYEL